MEQIYKDFEKTIKKNVSFRFTPKYSENLELPGVNPRLIIEVVQKVVEALDWEVIYMDDSSLEANTTKSKWSANYAVTISLNHVGRMEVKSVSTGNEMIDFGANSKKVKLFIYAFQDIFGKYDQSALNELQKQVDKEDKMSDYVIPETLPQPVTLKTPNRLIVWIGGLLFSIAAAYLTALISYHGIYIIGIFEIVTAWLAAFCIKKLLKLSNFTDLKSYMQLVAVMTTIIFIGEQFFQYLIFIIDTGYTFMSFFDFMSEKIAAGINYKNLNMGPIGLIVSWGLEIFLLYIFLKILVLQKVVIYMATRVQPEVVDFAKYYFVQGKTEDEVKAELSKMGWNTDLHHQMVWDAFGGITGILQFRRK